MRPWLKGKTDSLRLLPPEAVASMSDEARRCWSGSWLDLIPTRRLYANQMVTLGAMMAHNLGRDPGMQMLAQERSNYSRPKRPPAWTFQSLGTLRQRLLHRAGRLTQPQGELTLTMNSNPKVEKDLLHFLEMLKEAA